MSWGEPALSVLFAGGYLALLTLLWLALWVSVPKWGAAWRLPRPDVEPPADGPLVSICVPARNEAGNIGPCVQAARAQTWPRLEVIVVDDKSTDGTGAEARAAAGGDDRVRVVAGTEPPGGWAGKPWACTRAAGEATGELLLFIDADVRLDPQAVHALVTARRDRQVGLVSLFGSWEVVSFWERALVPAIGWLIRGVVDLDRVNDPGRPEAFANGQCILVERQGYEALDGHGVVRDQVLDDVRFAHAWKQSGRPQALLVAPWAFHVRLYRSLSEIVAGYSKNLYEGMGRQPILGLGSVLFIAVGALLPFAALFTGTVGRLALGWRQPELPWLLWLALVCGLQIAFRHRQERNDGRSGTIAWAHPLANLVMVWILLRAVLGVRASWKGREFVDGRAARPEDEESDEPEL
ncbi:MAG: glycosyltransferase [Alphaproteobacteria bacterium]|nr:glycosyltransferase [Alphaproteobacteria bacterium]